MGGKKLKIFFPIFQKSTTTLNPYLSKLSNLQLSKMNSNFFTQLTATIEKTVIDVLAQHVRGFSQALAEKSEGKFTSEQVMEVWNTLYPEATISASTPAHAEAKSPTQRTKTDKTRQCEVKKTAGKDKGNPCGKNCVVGKDTCVAHTPKNSEPSSPASPASKSVTGAASSIGSNGELAKLLVEDLKALCRLHGVEFTSKDRKQALIDKLSEYRDSQSSKPRSQKTLEEAFSSPAPKVAQKATTPVEVKTSTPSASTSATSTPIGSDEELTKMKVVDLKALCRLHEVTIGSKDLKNDLIASLIKKRDSMVPTTKVEEKEKVTEEVEEVEEEEVEDQEDEFDEEEEVEEEEVDEVDE